jgi:threonylcarbamoyladenosine tRNA methylthiotransferase MtaB
MTFALHSIGCRLNQYEIEAIGAKLEALDFQNVPFAEPADVTVINTCTVTVRADSDARGAIRKARRASPHGKIIVTGCYVQAQPDQLRNLGEIDLLVDNLDKDKLVERMIDAFGYDIPGGVDFETLNGPNFAVDSFRRHTRAMVKIQDGCQEACTFCIIPKARGHERSRSPKSILAEITALEANGYKEVVLTGVHVGKYRFEDWRLVDLLRAILCETGLPNIRLTSLEPREFRPALVELLVSEPRLCPHLHIPLQSGHDDVLRGMRRGYDTNYVRKLFGQLLSQRPEIAIGSDVITGFPGETHAQFSETVDFIRSLPIAYLHVFSYSDRPGTAAAAMPGKVAPEVTKQRTSKLRSVSEHLREAFLSLLVGQTLQVLIERRREPGASRLIGLSGNYMRVHTHGPDSWMNEIIPLRIVRCEGEVAFGEAA